MEIEVTRGALAAIADDAAQRAPRECCGILLGKGGSIEEARPCRNVHETPERRFEIDPVELVRAHREAREGGPEVIGYYHSHPGGSALPSATDRDLAPGDGRIWAIATAGCVTLWRDAPSGFEALSYRVIDG